MDQVDRFRGCLLGLACGDAVGTTVEFQPRGSFSPVTDMVGDGCFRLAPGEWTDDTSMALCLATSLVERQGFDPRDQMQRYIRWMDEGYLSSNGRCFDIGNTVLAALRRFEASGEPFSGATDPRSAGNGCLMRLAPVPMYFHKDLPRAVEFAAESARTTHGAQECLDACRYFAAVLVKALAGAEKEAVLANHAAAAPYSPKIAAIAEGAYRDKTERQIRGTGYVVESLEAALWCFHKTDSFAEAVLSATNLGEDADTTAAICGQVAGAFYGRRGIPAQWLERVALHDEIQDLADRLLERPAQPS